jgi:hypothetical protein
MRSLPDIGFIKRTLVSTIMIILLLSLPGCVFAQENQSAPKKDNFWSRVAVGGNLGFQFGSTTAIIINPEVMVRLVDQLHLGVGFDYGYYHYKYYYQDTRDGSWLPFTTNMFGGRIFLRYYLRSLFDNFLGNLFLHAEYEYLTYSLPYTVDGVGPILDPAWNRCSPGKQTVEVSSLLVGGGYKQPIGGRAYMDLLILYNLNSSFYSPYNDLVFRIGFGVGL